MVATELRLSLDWELWVTEQLLFTGKLDDITEILVEQGIPQHTAHQHVAAILASPGFARLSARVKEADLSARLQRLQRSLHPPGIAVLKDIDRETLRTEHWIASRPVVLTQAARSMRAVQQWSMSTLADRFGDVEILVNTQRDAASTSKETEQHTSQTRFSDLVARATGEATNDFYVVSRNGLLSLDGLAPLWDDFSPLPQVLDPPQAPQGVSLWLGPAGTVTPAHFDPHNVLLVQVEGEKTIRLAPRLHAALHDRLDGYYLSAPLDDVFMAKDLYEVRLTPGDALFIPVGWFHQVTAHSPSLTLSFLSFPWHNHFHWLGPPGSDDKRN